MLRSVHPYVQAELDVIRQSVTPPNHFKISAVIHANGQDVKIALVNALEEESDYLSKYAPIMKLSALMERATYDKVVYPNLDVLEITITKTPLNTTVSGPRDIDKTTSIRYKAKVYDVSGSSMTMDTNLSAMTNTGGLASLKDVEFQIYEKGLDVIRTSNVGTTPRKGTPLKIIETIIGDFLKKTQGQQPAVFGISIAPNYSNEEYEQVPIPHGTPFYKMPKIVNEAVGGIYSTGFSHFIQKGIWYLFSPFDLKRYDLPSTLRKLTVITVPPMTLNGIEKTYRYTPEQVILISTSKSQQLDLSEREQENEGVGFRFVDPRKLEEGISNIGGVVSAAARDFLNEISTTARRDGTVVMDDTVRLSSKYRLAYSKVAPRFGSIISTFWENSRPELLYPGMPIKYVYFRNGVAIEKNGILIGAITRNIPANADVGNPIYGSTTFLRMFISR